jgi:MFS transporter, ACDE family, multidrug resistance protein
MKDGGRSCAFSDSRLASRDPCVLARSRRCGVSIVPAVTVTLSSREARAGGGGAHRGAFRPKRSILRSTVAQHGRIDASPDEICQSEAGSANSPVVIGRAIIPTTIGGLPRRSAMSLLSLFFVPGAAQAILLTVVPLEALHLLGSARAVTLLYIGAGLIAVLGRFSIPFLVGSIGRRSVFTLGTLSLAASSILFALNDVRFMACGLVLSTFAFACIEITSQLYVLDRVPRHSLRHFEPIRIFAIAGPWTVGPWLGVHVSNNVSFVAPFCIAIAAAVILLVIFWSMRLVERFKPSATVRLSSNPARLVRRFFAQPRLRLAWTLAAARSSWWNLFYIYMPIFAVTSGLGAEVGGIVVSIGSGWIWLVPFWGWVGRSFGLRRLLRAGYAGAGVLSICAALAFGLPWLGVFLLALAALGTETIDGAGNLLFLRAVRVHERPEMTTVFVSFRDVSQLGPPTVCALLLTVFGLPSVFIAGGSMMLAAAVLTNYIPRRM